MSLIIFEMIAGLVLLTISDSRTEESPVKTANDDLVDSLPGLPYKIDFKQYAGYLNATNNGTEKYFFYWLTESQGNPDKDPLLLWLNGGPGCSSVGGLIEENGPFRPNPGGKTLFEDRFSWNKAANLLYIESPAGVGFSYIPNGDVNATDDSVSEDNYYALKSFFTKFNAINKYIDNEFYISGESYAGVYIPTLATRIIKGLQENDFPIEPKGLAIGNGMLSYRYQTDSSVALLYYRGVIDVETYEAVNTACCNGPNITCDYNKHLKIVTGPDLVSDGTECGNKTAYLASTLVQHTLNDYYNQYQDCYKTKYQVNRLKTALGITEPTIAYPIGDTVPDTARIINYQSTDALWGFPCWQDNVQDIYMNRMDVKKSLHVTPDRINANWSDCSQAVENGYYLQYADMNLQFADIVSNSNISILVYNGDVDSACNFLGDEWFVRNFTDHYNLTVTAERQPWIYGQQIAGYIKQYERITLLTVKGSGHFVPLDRAGPALQMITNFMTDKTTANFSKPVPFDLTLKALNTVSTSPTIPTTPSAATITQGSKSFIQTSVRYVIYLCLVSYMFLV